MRNVYERKMIEGIAKTSELAGDGASEYEIEMSLIGALDGIVAYYVYKLKDSDLTESEKMRRLKNMIGRAVQRIHDQSNLWISTFGGQIGYFDPEGGCNEGWNELFVLDAHLRSRFVILPDWQVSDRQAILDLFDCRR